MINSELIIQLAEITSNENSFYDLTSFTNGIGFSAKRNYPKGLLYQPNKQNSGPPEFAHITFALYPDLIDDLQRIPILIQIVRYGFSPRISTNIYMHHTHISDPIEVYESGLLLDLKSLTFVDKDNKQKNPLKVLEETFEAHLAPSFRIKGSLYRFQLRLYKIYNDSLLRIGNLLKGMMWLVSGKIIIDSKKQPDRDAEIIVTDISFHPILTDIPFKLISDKATIEHQGVRVSVNSVLFLYTLAFCFWFLRYYQMDMSLRAFVERYLSVMGFLAVPIYLAINYIFPKIVIIFLKWLSRSLRNALWRKGNIQIIFGLYYLNYFRKGLSR